MCKKLIHLFTFVLVLGVVINGACLAHFEKGQQAAKVTSGVEIGDDDYENWEKAWIFPSTPPADCPFEQSEVLTGIAFTGRAKYYTYNGTVIGDTWFPSWGADDRMYSCFADGRVERLDGASDLSLCRRHLNTGSAILEGDDPRKLHIYSMGLVRGEAAPYEARYPSASLHHDGVWYIGTYCLDDVIAIHGDKIFNWGLLCPLVGFRTSTDGGKTWKVTQHTVEKPLFPESALYRHPVKIGAPHFVDFGKNMEHSPDGKAYLVAHGAEFNDPQPRGGNLTWMTGDQIYLIRVEPSIENINDSSKYEFFSGHDEKGEPVWTKKFADIKPLLEWNNHMGGVTITWHPFYKRYLMCVTDGTATYGPAYDSYILESENLTGPWKLVTYMEAFGEQGYFLNFPSKFLSADGVRSWLFYSGSFGCRVRVENEDGSWKLVGCGYTPKYPPGGRYGLAIQQTIFLDKERQALLKDNPAPPRRADPELQRKRKSTK